jgi:2,3-dihydroxybenzoate-AMP ligase
MPLDGFPQRDERDVERYVRSGCWTDTTLGDLLDHAADRCPEKEALVDNRSRVTYAQFRDRANRLALGLRGLGIGRGDCVLLQMPDWSEFAYSFFALHKIGAVAVLLLTRHRQVEINYFCALTRAKAWILPERHRNTDYAPIVSDVMRENPSLEHIVAARSTADSRFVSLEALVAREYRDAEIAGLSDSRPKATDVAFVIPTGGTTGLPKAVPRTHNDAVCEATYKATAREQNGDDTCMISVPLEHNLGLAAFNGTIALMGRTVLLDSTRAEDLCATIQRERVTCAPLVPTLLSRLAGFDGLQRYDLTSLKAFYVGGAKTPADVIKTIHRRLGKVYIGAFGMSEGPGCTTRLDDTEDTVLNSIGRPCCPFDTFKVAGADGRDLPRNAEGELLAKGPCVFSGYLSNPAENKRAFTRDGFFRTGDLARIDDLGYIRITGRIKDIIIRGGENISPTEMESLIRAHPDVADVAVVGIPDPDLGEIACACIQPKGGAKPGLEDIVPFLKDRGASVLQLPERIELIRQIPRTPIGKADKKALQADIAKRSGQPGRRGG